MTFHGLLTHTDVQTLLSRANLITLPSIREFGGGVVPEAMARSVVPIAVNYAGPGELVTETTWYKVPIGTYTEIVASLRTPSQALVTDAPVLSSMGAAAHAMQAFTWSAKARQVSLFYNWVLERGHESASG
ncbi:glycosyltransferase [Roseobacter sp. OBYS 0001]|uniref:glycosyltransferase n=1 Tax=Roseobacter sp. OBYS 0001 TaxID=882651 RepID=UPI001BBC1B34|nr:glycosyltransferase [Roseobacter sp. OBYS 0001]GIT89248.1 hypothetical protein ROBYS_42640 [Roseobacter sp. OBYS 0001]